jgi:acetyl-CoA synthetase
MSDSIETYLHEDRRFPPSPEFVEKANLTDPEVYARANDDFVRFWESWASALEWKTRWQIPLVGEGPDSRWFVGGKLNACQNCVDRHVAAGKGNKTAIVWEGEDRAVRTVTYAELQVQVAKLANALKGLGVQKGDRVCLYMPLVPELVVAMLACARIGAVHSVVFGGFSSDSLYERIQDAGAKVVITADGGLRRGNRLALKATVDEALDKGCPSVQSVLVLARFGDVSEEKLGWLTGRDHWWHEFVDSQEDVCPCEPMDSEDLLFILYTSGSTGKPKGIMHATGGYMTGATATANWVFDLKEDDIYWCTADCGWITGHSYVVYGPLSNGATVLLYEGAPDFPKQDRFWEIIERHRVTVFYTAPTAIRSFMKWGSELPKAHDLSSLRLLGSVGEPINPEAWMWYRENIGGNRCPIVDTWWQTETGHIMITPLPGITVTKPGSATKPFPGIEAVVLSEDGSIATEDEAGEHGGFLCISRPWPGMLRGIWGDRERYLDTYWRRFPGKYFTGDGAKIDSDGYFWLLGRVDDVMLVAGHNISTMEVESALVSHPSVAEAAVIGKKHEIKGQAIAAFVTVRNNVQASQDLEVELRAHVAAKIGSFAKPDEVIFCPELPKTRSGKIMRRLLRDLVEGKSSGDVSTLADANALQALKREYEHKEG